LTDHGSLAAPYDRVGRCSSMPARKETRFMKVVLFCGGQGLRIREHSETIPKPMVTVGYRPILWHVMRYYAHWGMKDFILCLGYRADAIKDYFLRYSEALSNDFVMADGGRSIELLRSDIHDWRISFIDTGLNASVGQRLKSVGSLLADDDIFLANYGDVLTNAPLPDLIRRFQRSGKLAGFVAVRPSSYTFHLVKFDGKTQVREVEDVGKADLWLNGGYFMFRREILDEIGPGEDIVPDVLPRLIARGEVLGYRYDGFWAPMDTLRDWQKLDGMVQSGDMPWAVWQKPPADAVPHKPEVKAAGVDGAA
jgi:glucose-1-phosphate cytidylyltransferase